MLEIIQSPLSDCAKSPLTRSHTPIHTKQFSKHANQRYLNMSKPFCLQSKGYGGKKSLFSHKACPELKKGFNFARHCDSYWHDEMSGVSGFCTIQVLKSTLIGSSSVFNQLWGRDRTPSSLFFFPIYYSMSYVWKWNAQFIGEIRPASQQIQTTVFYLLNGFLMFQMKKKHLSYRDWLLGWFDLTIRYDHCPGAGSDLAKLNPNDLSRVAIWIENADAE